MAHAASAAPSLNIYLLGLMGSGKSTVGRQLAQILVREFIDLDNFIEEQAQKLISVIFLEHGEAHFRELESQCLQDISSKKTCVIALGGGAILEEKNRLLIQSTGLSIYLKVRPETLLKRLSDSEHRPLLAGLNSNAKLVKLQELERVRSGYYEEANLIIENETAPQEAIEKILAALPTLCARST